MRAPLLLAAALLACRPAHGSGVSDLGPRLTAKLLNASATFAATPKVNATITALQANQAEAEAVRDQKLGLPIAKGVVTPTATEAALPLATLGAKCGAGVAKCLHGCCSQEGVCALSPAACGPLCQADYSALLAPCAANPVPAPPPPSSLPRVGLGAPCGAYVAACEVGCCNQLNYCVPDDTYACAVSSCDLAASPNSAACFAVHKAAKPVTRRYKLVATWGRAAPDGFETDVVLVNGKFPAPTLRANAGDRVIVEYVNKLGVPSTLHWHGLKQIETNTMDGVDPVTQRGIPGLAKGRRRRLAQVDGASANETLPPPPTFLYDFTAEAAGIYWYHDHSDALVYVDGLRGAFIVSDWQSPVLRTYDNEPYIFIADQYHQRASILLQSYLTPANTDGIDPVPKSIWINGLTGAPTPWCGGSGQPPCRTSVIHAGPLAGCGGEANTKLMLINGASFALVRLHIEADYPVKAVVVTQDGIPTPAFSGSQTMPSLTVASPLQLAPGQRAGVLICSDDPAAAASKPATLVVRAPLDQFPPVTPGSNGLGLSGPDAIVNVAKAVLDFSGAYDNTRQDGSTLPPPGSLSLPFNGPDPATLAASTAVQAVWGRAPGAITTPPPAATRSVPLTITTGYLAPGVGASPSYFFINDITFSAPHDPSMLAAARAGATFPNAAANTAGYNVLSFKLGEVVDMIIFNADAGGHPLHLHGQSFWVMGEGLGQYNAATSPPLTPLYARDVAGVKPNSYLVIRFVASHPQLWFFHCHIEFHLAAGLALVVETK